MQLIDKSFVELVFSEFLQQQDAQREHSFKYLRENPDSAAKLDAIRTFGSHTFLQAVPSSIDILARVGYFPFAEASFDLDYAIAHALTGAYKTAYFPLRSFLELGFVGLYFTSEIATSEEANQWIKSVSFTPFFGHCLKKLFSLSNFESADRAIGLRDMLRNTYGNISDRTHTRGEKHGHMRLSYGNRPRFVQSSLLDFIQHASLCCEALAISLVVQQPIALVPLPVDEKFGLNPPISGFLQHHEVDNIKALVNADCLRWLEAYVENDVGAQSLRQWFESRPDITEEEMKQQEKQQQEFFAKLRAPPDTT